MITPNRKGEVWVFAEQEDERLNDVSLELCGKARELADRLGVKMAAVLIGSNVRELSYRLIAHGADRVYHVDDARLEHLTVRPSGAGNSLRFHVQLHAQPTESDLIAEKERLRANGQAIMDGIRELLKAPRS